MGAGAGGGVLAAGALGGGAGAGGAGRASVRAGVFVVSRGFSRGSGRDTATGFSFSVAGWTSTVVDGAASGTAGAGEDTAEGAASTGCAAEFVRTAR